MAANEMLTLYLVSAIVAGVLILLSLLGADHGHDHDGGEIGHEGHEGDHGGIGHWIPFLSLRFYTYFFAGLGATGLLLHFFTTTPAQVALTISIATGFLSGISVWMMIKLLRRTESTSTATESDLMGKEGTVLVAINGRNPGRIRCTVRGDIIDFLAISEEEIPINPGQSVVVVSLENGRALVIPREAIFGENALPSRTSS